MHSHAQFAQQLSRPVAADPSPRGLSVLMALKTVSRSRVEPPARMPSTRSAGLPSD